MDQSHKFLTLDALRGVAALLVVMFHAADFTGRPIIVHGYLAVDFFFMLSGFVLSYAYQDRLDQGWASLSFLKARFIRLYPLYFLGLICGLTLRLLDHHFGKPSPGSGAVITLVALGLLLVPNPMTFANVSAFAFPLNIPAWSLFFECVANLVHAWLLRRRGRKWLVSLAAFTAIFFLWYIVRNNRMDFGSHWTDLTEGLPRVLYSYIIGMLMLRIWRKKLFRVRMPAWSAALVLILLLTGPPRMDHPVVYDVVVTFFCFPLLLLLSANSPPATRHEPLFRVLGTSSYAIYVLHLPFMAVFFAALRMLLTNHNFQAWATVEIFGFAIIILLVALLIDHFYDQPVRQGLRRKLAAVR